MWKLEKGTGQDRQPHHQEWWADQCHLPIAPLPASHPNTAVGPCCWADHSLPRAHMGSCHTRSHWTCGSTGPLHLTGQRFLSVMLLKELTTGSYCTGRIGKGGVAGVSVSHAVEGAHNWVMLHRKDREGGSGRRRDRWLFATPRNKGSCAFSPLAYYMVFPPAETSCKYTHGAVGKKYSGADSHTSMDSVDYTYSPADPHNQS